MLPDAKDAVVLADCESDKTNGWLLMRYADVRRAQVAKLALGITAFEGTSQVSAAFPADGETAKLQAQAAHLLNQSRSRLEVLRRDQEQRTIRRRTQSLPNFN